MMSNFITRYFERRKAKKTKNLAMLKEIHLFNSITDDELLPLSDLFINKQFKQGEVIFRENYPHLVLYIVQSGRVKIFFEIPASSSDVTIATADNSQQHSTSPSAIGTSPLREIPIKEVTVNQSFGEVGMFGDMPRLASATAMENTNLIAIKKSDLKIFIKRNPATGIKLLNNLAKAITEDYLLANTLLKKACSTDIPIATHKQGGYLNE